MGGDGYSPLEAGARLSQPTLGHGRSRAKRTSSEEPRCWPGVLCGMSRRWVMVCMDMAVEDLAPEPKHHTPSPQPRSNTLDEKPFRAIWGSRSVWCQRFL